MKTWILAVIGAVVGTVAAIVIINHVMQAQQAMCDAGILTAAC